MDVVVKSRCNMLSFCISLLYECQIRCRDVFFAESVSSPGRDAGASADAGLPDAVFT